MSYAVSSQGDQIGVVGKHIDGLVGNDRRQMRPVRFRYNGRAGTTAGQTGIGVLGHEIEAIVPETIHRVNVASDPGLHDMRVFDPSALTYVLINAVKELAAKVEHLEQALAGRGAGRKRPPRQSSREAQSMP